MGTRPWPWQPNRSTGRIDATVCTTLGRFMLAILCASTGGGLRRHGEGSPFAPGNVNGGSPFVEAEFAHAGRIVGDGAPGFAVASRGGEQLDA